MQNLTRRASLALMLTGLAACVVAEPEPKRKKSGGRAEINRLITKYARVYNIPEDLIHRVVARESSYNPAARNGPYYGLMQILPDTAFTMGYRGRPKGLLDADTNLKYGCKYLRGAWIVADGDRDKAVMWYSRGYYYEAKRRGLLKKTGLRS
jgi:soluble lytic murein transglycosylase-like protein